MQATRRSFLKGLSAGALTLSVMGFDLKAVQAYATSLKIEGAKEIISVCPFCAVCCQIIAHVKDGKLVSTEGDPDFPVNEGALCAKGAALLGMYTHTEGRVLKPMYRAPYSDRWEEKDWDWTIDRIAHLVKEARDKDFKEKNEKGEVVNRLESLFWMGVVVLICWEVRFFRHPERFWHGSNLALRCDNCTDRLCRYKKLTPKHPI